MTALSAFVAEADHAPTIEITSTPAGLLVAIDRLITKHTTPATFTLEPGKHRISLVGDEGDVWSTTIVAKADHRYEFSPSISRDRLEPRERVASDARAAARERARERESMARKSAPSVPPSASPTNSLKEIVPGLVAERIETGRPSRPSLGPDVLSGGNQTNGLLAIAPPPKATDTQKPKKRTSPRVIVARDVVRVSGKFPSIRQKLIERAGSSRSGAVLLCISTSGRVTSAKALNKKLPAEVNSTFVKAAKNWRYKPYREQGAAVPACFSVVFRLRSSR